MLSILQKEFNTMHKSGGNLSKLTPEDKMYVTLKYLREYRTMDVIAKEYGVCKCTVCLVFQWVVDILVKDGAFELPGKEYSKESRP